MSFTFAMTKESHSVCQIQLPVKLKKCVSITLTILLNLWLAHLLNKATKKSTADLYDRIVKELFTFEALEDLLQKQDLILQNSESLQTNFKDHFTTKNWEKIKRFELHFVKQHQNYSKWNATTVLDEKYIYFNTLKQLNDKQKEFSESCSNVIKTDE